MDLLILPNQLFDVKYFPNSIQKVILYEHPQYFTKYNFNKKKLILHRASMKKYESYLIKKKYKVKYVEFGSDLPTKFDIIFEYIFGVNVLGFKSNYSGRIASFTGDELQIGGYYFGFIFLSLSFFADKKKNYLFFSQSLSY